MPFIPHAKKDVVAMLSAINIDNIDTLFSEIPSKLRTKSESLKLPAGITEFELQKLMQKLAISDAGLICFAGGGAYEHHIPAAVWQLASRGEFYTSYTPYQAEASQGTLQLLYEYQSMMAAITQMQVANASLYDGSSALAEAILMALRVRKKSKSKKILIPTTVNPAYRKVTNTIISRQEIEQVYIPYDVKTGTIKLSELTNYDNNEIDALVIQQPNFFGCLEEIDYLTNWAHAKGAMVIAVVNPTSLAILNPPGNWGDNGADIVCGEGQPLGIPLSSGGPYFGFLTSKMEFVRQMPGRIIGKTKDIAGKVGYSLTLQAREQHIRRAKATSNICTNQGLLVTSATIYLSLLGSEGLTRVAKHCHTNTKYLIEKLSSIKGIVKIFTANFFHEVVIKLPCRADIIREELAAKGFLAGIYLEQDYPELVNCLLVCATEVRSKQEIDEFAATLENSCNLETRKEYA